ncbi:MAG TPA: hypothetical protein PK263_01985 [bacterium]|nr:hypothetical protein [bacterium]
MDEDFKSPDEGFESPDEDFESPQEALNAVLKTSDGQALICYCERFARGLMAQRYWKGTRGGIPPGGYGPEDIVEIVIIKTLNETINCNQKIKLKTFLCMNIRSVVSAMSRSKENRCVRSEQYFESTFRSYNNAFDLIVSLGLSEGNGLSFEIDEKEVKEILMEYLKTVQNDIMLSKVGKILILGRVVFPECFCHIVDDVDGLARNLVRYGYIDDDGMVQDSFFSLKCYSEMRLYKRFSVVKDQIYCVISRSIDPDLEMPVVMAQWLNVDACRAYYFREKLRESLLKYLRRFNKEELAWIIRILKSRQRDCMLCSILPE